MMHFIADVSCEVCDRLCHGQDLWTSILSVASNAKLAKNYKGDHQNLSNTEYHMRARFTRGLYFIYVL